MNNWNSGTIRPSQQGIYIRHIADEQRKSKWDGKNWMDLFLSYKTKKTTWMKSYYQDLEWSENDK